MTEKIRNGLTMPISNYHFTTLGELAGITHYFYLYELAPMVR